MNKCVRFILGFFLLLSPSPSILYQWFPKSSFSQTFAKGQSILNVGPFLDEDDFTKCTKSIMSADWNFNKKVERVEFHIAVAIWTNDKIPALSSQKSLPISAAFIEHACVVYRFCDPSTQVCCEEGFEQYISIAFDPSQVERNLFQVCAATETAIRSVTDLLPSLAPSPPSPPSALSLEISQSPSKKPTNEPTLFPTSTPTKNPTPLPTEIPSLIQTNDPTLFPTSRPTNDMTTSPTSQATDGPTLSPMNDPTLRPTSITTNAPSSIVTNYASSFPSMEQTIRISVAPTAAHSGIPSDLSSSRPTGVPTGDPTETQSFSPSYSRSIPPSLKPSFAYSSSPTAFKSSIPTLFPTTPKPTTIVSLSPTDSISPSSITTNVPTLYLSEYPSTSLSEGPIATPSESPTAKPSENPTGLVSNVPTVMPTINPTLIPIISSAPSKFGKLSITLTYGLRTEGINAEAILAADNNNIAESLIIAVTTVVLSLLGEESSRAIMTRAKGIRLSSNTAPSDITSYKNNSNSDENVLKFKRLKSPRKSDLISVQVYDKNTQDRGSKRARRNLASYNPAVPVFHKSILQDVCDPVNGTDECIIIKTVVTLFRGVDENADEIRSSIVKEFNDAINDGTFFTVLSQI